MSQADTTTAAAYLKENYNDDLLSDAIPKAAPLLYFLPKHDDWTGNNYVQPIKYANPQAIGSGSSVLSTLISSPGSTAAKRFLLSTSKHYGVVQIDRELILASSNDIGAFVSELDNEVNSCVDEMGRNFGRQAFGNSDGHLGQVSSISSHVITLTNKGDAVNFEVGMVLDVFTAVTAGSQHDSSGITVTAVNENAGTLTVSGDSATTTNDYLFRQSSRGSEWSGLADWFPTAVPSSSAFFNIDRSVSPRLYGQFLDGSTGNFIDNLINACMKVDKQGGRASHIFLPFEYYRLLSQSEQVQKRYPQPSADEAKLGFSGIEVITPYGSAMVYPDRFCPSTKAYVLSMDSMKCVSRGPLVQWIAEDGTIILRAATADSFQARMASYSNLLCMHPIANAVIYNLPDLT